MTTTTYTLELVSKDGHRIRVTSASKSELVMEFFWADDVRKALDAGARFLPMKAIPDIDDLPVCPTHEVPLVRQPGYYGAVLSCHARDIDGKQCLMFPGLTINKEGV